MGRLVTFGMRSRRLHHLTEVEAATRARRAGHAVLRGPTRVVAGGAVDLTFELTVGDAGLPAGGQFGLAWRLPGDWGDPQWTDPGHPNFFAADGAMLEFHHRGGPDPWNHYVLFTLAAPLAPGVALTVRASGWEAQTASHPAHPFLCIVRPHEDDEWLRMVDPVPIAIVGGPPHSWALICPSQCVAGEPFAFTVRCTDLWGNPTAGAAKPEVGAADSADMAVMSLSHLGDWGGVWRGVARIDTPGLHRLRIAGTESNPILCTTDPAAESIVWGDMHGGQCDLGCGQGDLDRYFAYARDVAALDFVSHQANDVYVKPNDWNHTRRVTEAHDQPGQFAAFLGCEWTTPSANGGDRNVFYRYDQLALPRANRWYEIDDSDWPDNPTPRDLYRTLDGVEALINLHVGGFTSNLDWHDPRLERLIEVHSTHATSRWFIADAIARGSRLGIAGGSDGVSGRPGADHPGRRQSRNLRNGVTGLILRGTLDRDSVWEALRGGRFFATSGPRMRLDVRCIGDEIHVEVAGTAAIEAILLRRGGDVAAEQRVAPSHSSWLRLAWWGSRTKGTTRDQRLAWDGRLSADAPLRVVSSSGFIEPVDAVELVSPTAVQWRSVTAGNRASIVLDTAAARFRCETPPHSFSCGLSGYAADIPEFVDAGIALGPAPDPTGSREASARFALDDSGAYWIEVLQVDGECAFYGVVEHQKCAG